MPDLDCEELRSVARFLEVLNQLRADRGVYLMGDGPGIYVNDIRVGRLSKAYPDVSDPDEDAPEEVVWSYALATDQ